MGEARAAGVRAAWSLAHVLLADPDGAADAVATTLGAQPAWLAPPSEVELLTAVARDLASAPVAQPAAGLGDGFWGLPPETRGALWLTAGDHRPPAQVAQILSLAPTSVLSLVEEASAALLPEAASPTCPDLVRLERHLAGTLPPSGRTRMEGHLRRCAPCRARVAHLADRSAVGDQLCATVAGPLDEDCSARLDRLTAVPAEPPGAGPEDGPYRQELFEQLDREHRWSPLRQRVVVAALGLAIGAVLAGGITGVATLPRSGAHPPGIGASSGRQDPPDLQR